MAAANAAGVVLALALAPYQCGHSPDPDVRREDTPGDALWSLADDFEARHEDRAALDTLRFLVAKYPSNRHADAARDRIARAGHAGGSAGRDVDDRAPGSGEGGAAP